MKPDTKMIEQKKSAEKTRYRMLDLVRGVAIFVMIAAHAVYFFHNDTSGLLSLVEKFGNTIAFTTFMIVSGATAMIAYFSKEENWPKRRRRLFKRIGILLIGYAIITLVVFFAEIVSTHGIAKLELLLDIATFRKLPSFAEFYIPFVVFPIIVSLFPRFFRKITKSLVPTIVVSLVIYILGMVLYRVPVTEFLVPWKGLFVGAEGYYRFPILQYFPIYLLGMVWGYKLLTLKVKQQVQLAEGVMLTAGLGLVFIITTYFTLGRSLEEMMRRWPPTIPFLLAGIFFASLVALFFYFSKQLDKSRLLRDGILVLGQNALGLALTHIFLLQVYTLSGGTKTGSLALYLIGFTILMLLSIVLAAVIPFNFRFVLNLERGKYREEEVEQETLVRFEEEATEYIEKDVSKIKKFFFLGRKMGKADERLIRRRHILGVAIALSLATLVAIPPIAEQYQMQKKNSSTVAWYNDEYGWRKNITIRNNESLAEIPKGSLLKFYINHSELVTAKKALVDGSDLTVVYWNGKKYDSVNFAFTSQLNQASSSISIELKERIKPGDDSNDYYLYYGNNLKKKTPRELKNPTQIKNTVTLSEEEKFPMLLTIDRRWSLLTDDPKIPKTLRITLQTDQDYQATEANYTIEGTRGTGKLEKTAEKQWEGVIELSSLIPGEYRLKAQIKDQGQTYQSSVAGFYVSHPLYIAWTQDWEGYDVPDVYLAAITQVARDHGLVITHFWNPRLSITESVNEERKSKLLDWVKIRESVFDESIQLHLHMFNDFVSESGVAVKNSPNWGDSGDGYGTLTTNYSTDEMTKMVKYGIEIMVQSGLKPTIFRAGGWFANLSTLKAVQDSGLLADSSGRTAYNFYSQKGPWNLSATSQPYYPSESDQNKSGSPALSVLEIPNNGADSYWFSTEEMKKRFIVNYSGGILENPKQITYLSHPHWFNKNEQNKIRGVFDLIDVYKYDNDSGPALYVTLDEIYKVWKK